MTVPLRIAVDARPLSIPRTGIGRYTDELLRRLLQTEHHWFLYSDRPLLRELPEQDNLTIRTGRSSRRITGTLYPQWIYPRWARRDRIDVFWSPRHHLPLALSSSIRTVLTLHDLVGFIAPETMTRMGRQLETWLTPRSVRKTDALIVDAASTLRDLDRVLGYGVDKASVVPLGASINALSEVMPRPLAQDYFLFVGTQEPRKNLVRLLHAFAAQASSMPDVKLVLAGGAGWGDQLEQQITELAIGDRVILTGRLDEASLHSYYRSALALVLPSLYEGFGLPLLEAMQYGVPVVTSNCSSMPEVAGDGGILVDPRDCGSIGDALRRMASDPALHRGLAVAARAQAAHFSWDASAAQTLAILENGAPQDAGASRRRTTSAG